MKCCEITPGMLREPVVFQRKELTQNGSGDFTKEWSPLRSTRAQVKAIGGTERYASDRVEASVRIRMVVRYFPGLLESDRVMIRDRAHNIRFIENVGFADRWLRIDLDGGAAT